MNEWLELLVRIFIAIFMVRSLLAMVLVLKTACCHSEAATGLERSKHEH
jgi:hypothetical protein